MARKKKRRISIKKISVLIIIIVVITTIIFNLNSIRNFYISKMTGYDIDTVEAFIEKNIYSDVKNCKYSKTLEVILNTEYYDDKYLNEYINIDYVDNEDFLNNTSLLLDKGYISEDINIIYENLDDEAITVLLDSNYVKDIVNLISVEYFHSNNLDRYIKYYEKDVMDIETIVTYVNIGLDNEYYTNVIDIGEPDSITVLVNKYHKLQSDYVPENLQDVSYGYGKLRKEAAIAFDEMCAAAKKDKIYIYGGSGYRSYSYQLGLYNRYAARDGKDEADTYSARAGYSEHQTGLAMDILNGSWDYIDENDKEYTWLVNNSYKYGFILRYLAGKEKITGYVYEPWHYRYIGIELATEITKLGITYDEYVAKK